MKLFGLNSKIPKRRRVRLRIRIIVIIVVLLCSWLISYFMEETQYGLSWIPFVVLVIASIFEFIYADIIIDRKYPPKTSNLLDFLKPKMSVISDSIESILKDSIEAFQYSNQSIISSTFHLRVDIYSNKFDDSCESGLLQITDYVGTKGGVNWRFTPPTKGIIGRCLRTEEPQSTNFRNEDEYAKLMVKDFGFIKQEIETHTKEARSYYASPAFHKDRIIGVVYFFATEPNIFPAIVNDIVLQSSIKQLVSYLDGADILEK